MNKQIMGKLGYHEEVKRFNVNLCAFCAKKVNTDDFRNELSAKEYHISGLCQKCQDNVFGED